jgi:Zn-finger nucleic acid-binding protein
MNRVNFAGCSGVIVDVCRGHGTWFDRDELQRVTAFIQAGGMEKSQALEVENLKEAERQARAAQFEAALERSQASLNNYGWGGRYGMVFDLAGWLMDLLR